MSDNSPETSEETSQYTHELLKQMRDWGTPRQMTPFETVMWRIEADPRMRSTITGVQILDCVPEWQRLRNAVEWATRVVPRFRQRVVEPAIGGVVLGAPAWVDDDAFDLDNHLRRETLPQPGTMRQLLDVAQEAAMSPFNRERSPWEAILVEGLEGNRAAFILKLHHSTTDGLGTIQLLNTLNSRKREHTPDKPEPLPRPERPVPTPGELVRDQLSQLPGHALNSLSKWLSPLLMREGHHDSTLVEIRHYLRSAGRVMAPLPAKPSPLLRGRSGQWHFEALVVPLAKFRAGARRPAARSTTPSLPRCSAVSACTTSISARSSTRCRLRFRSACAAATIRWAAIVLPAPVSPPRCPSAIPWNACG
jgi:hypothetical protein